MLSFAGRIVLGFTFAALSATVPALHAKDPVSEGVDVGSASALRNLVPANVVEGQASTQYRQLLQEAASRNALAPDNYPQLQRLRRIQQRLLPFTYQWNERSRDWRWEVNLIGSKQINAFCMPGGKIAFFDGLLKTLSPTDDEIAIVMGHEIAHALREHARARMGKSAGVQLGASVISQIFGFGNLGNTVLGAGANLLSLRFSRDDETEADIVGLDLAARAGYDPRAGVALWRKMGQASPGAPPQWLSTHPAGANRIREIESYLPRVLPLYARAIGKPLQQLPPYVATATTTTGPGTVQVPVQILGPSGGSSKGR